MLPVQNIPEQYLYRLLPQGVINLDGRKLLEAVMSGYQDRISDLRSYANTLNELVKPDAELPQLGFNVVLVTFAGQAGQIITRSLDINPSTPDLDDTAALRTWAANELQLDDSSLISNVVAGTDLLRQVNVDSISLLAGNVGTILYQGLKDDESPEAARRTRQQLLESYFPRLKIKGTADSFELLGRAIGFDAVAMTPLWSRLVPRLPNDPGNDVNNQDFNARPEQIPSATLPDQRYNPTDYRDGEYYTWSSGVLSEDPNDANFWTSINNQNPFVKVVQVGEIVRPVAGRYILTGGQPNRVPSVLLSSGLRLEAVAAGSSLNGTKVNVIQYASGVGLEITAKLSAVKYRSSYFDLKATIANVGTEPVQASPDLENNPTLAPDGVAVVPFRPWTGGSVAQSVEVFPVVDVGAGAVVQARSQAAGNRVQLDREEFDAAMRASTNLDVLKAATRRIRSRSVGLSVRDDAQFAAYPSETVLFTVNGVGTYAGFVPPSLAPKDPKDVSFQAWVGDFAATTYVDTINDGTVAVTGGDFYGIYRLADDYYSIAVFPGPMVDGNGRMEVMFKAKQGESIRAEPTRAAKLSGTVAYEKNPEDQINLSGSNISFYDEMPWRRDSVIAGQQVDDDFYLPAKQDLEYKSASAPYRVLALSGRQYEIAVLDSVQHAQPFRFRIIQNSEIDPLTGNPLDVNYDRLLLAEDEDRKQYHVLLIDRVVVASRYWSPAKRNDIVQWIPFNEHPLDDMEPFARYAVSVDSEINHANRLWDTSRGWYLKMESGDTVDVGGPTGLGNVFALAFWIKADASPTTGTGYSKVFQLGAFVSIEISNNASDSYVRLMHTVGGSSTEIGFFALTTSWSMIGVRRDNETIEFGLGTLNAAMTWQAFEVQGLDEVITSSVHLTCGERSYGIHDATVWSTFKSRADFDLIRDPSFVKSEVLYPTTYVESLSRDNWYIFKLVESGFAYPGKADVNRVRDQPAYAQRYNRQALFQGDDRFKEVGVGGGVELQPSYTLGLRGPYVEGFGTTILAGSYAPLPGYASMWGTVPGEAIRVAPPYTSNGGVVTKPATQSNPWPNNVIGNPGQDRIYVKGDDGLIYKIYADDEGSGVQLKAERTLRARPAREAGMDPAVMDQPTDAVTLLGSPGKRLSVFVNNGTEFQPYQANDASVTTTTPPVYLYRQTKVAVGALTTAFSRWANPNSFGQELGVPALSSNGDLSFTNVELLEPGAYQVTFDIGNIGTVDDNFAGFSTIVSFVNGSGSTLAQTTQVLLEDGAGEDPRAKVTFNVSLSSQLTGPWLLNVEWNNSLTVPRKGQKRQLAIYGYELRLISPALYQVSINPLSLTAVNLSSTSTVRAGGLIGKVNSYGTVASIDHEALTFPERSNWPLSNLLTSSTWARRQALRVVNPKAELDPSAAPVPSILTVAATGTNPYYNYGDVVNLEATVNNEAQARAYVWRFWDGSVETTATPEISKRVTPGLLQSSEGQVTVSAIDALGNSSSKTVNLTVNRPPSLSVTVDQNVGIFPYYGSMVASVTDPNGDFSEVLWLVDGTQVASGDNFNYEATAQKTVTVRAVDARGGVTDKRVSFSGTPRQKPLVSPIIRSDVGRISNLNELDFAVYALNPNTGGPLTFKWTFWNDLVPRLYATGVDDQKKLLGDNVRDFHYLVVDNSVSPLYNGVPYTLAGSPGVIVTPSPGIDGQSASRPQGYYDFRFSFAIPFGTDLSSVQITVTGTCNDYADIYVNGVLAISNALTLGQTKSFTLHLGNCQFTVGQNNIDFRVINTAVGSSSSFLSITSIAGTMNTVGVTTAVSNSNVKFNQAHKALAGSTPGEKIVQVVVTDEFGSSTTVQSAVLLIENSPPRIIEVQTTAPGVLAGSQVSYGAVVSDIDVDAISFVWTFTSPREVTLYGGNVKYQTLESEVGQTIEGTLTIDDGNGGTATADVPPVVIAESFLRPITLKVGPGFYQTGFVQEIDTLDEDVDLRYTLDGTDVFKNTDGEEYIGPFLVSPPEGNVGAVTLKVRGFKDGFAPTAQVTATFNFYDPNALDSSGDPEIGSTSNLTLVTVRAAGDTAIGTSEGSDIPGDSGQVTLSPQASLPQVSLANEPSLPFSPLPPPGQAVSSGQTLQSASEFVKLKDPI